MSVYFATKEEVAAKLYDILADAAVGFKSVDRQYNEVGDYDYPSIFINDVREARNRKLKDVVLVTWNVVLVLYTYDEQATLSTTLNADIKKAIDAIKDDVTLGGLVYNTKITQIDTDEGFLRPHAVALLTLEITYLKRS